MSTSKKKKLFTKSRFKTALGCPAKLYYESNPEIYANEAIDDPFMEALARGGFQVGELAKLYYPEGHDIKALNYDEALKETIELLKKENVVIFEAAIKYKGFFIRVDILEKKGNKINLIEVKSKSCDPKTFEDELYNKTKLKKGETHIKGDWKDYVYDVAMQTWVALKANPEWDITPYLMCADKSSVATVDGLNQKFRIIENENGRTECVVHGKTNDKALGSPVLALLDCTDVVRVIHGEEDLGERFYLDGKERGFVGGLTYLEKKFSKGEKIAGNVSSACGSCEFRSHKNGLKSGYSECMKEAFGLSEEETRKPFIFDVWDFRGSNKLLERNRPLMEDLDKSDFNIKVNEKGDQGITASERRWLQVEKELMDDGTPFFDTFGLEKRLSSFTYPLHFIDFETCMVAIPFNKGRSPYEQIAFQFSHHTMDKTGKITHKTEWINTTPGKFPNFEFVRALKKALGKKGTIFRFSHHENTVLLQIRDQLYKTKEKDKDELIEWIHDVTARKGSHEGSRNMVDLCELVKKYYYSPLTNGSNSIKAVLPAVLRESAFLKSKYGSPIYGSEIVSKNFKDHTWIELDGEGNPRSPYKTLPELLEGYDLDSLDYLYEGDKLADGGAAMAAYALIQFTDMSELEREAITKGLLRYCELDTMAMVMIFEYFLEVTGKIEAEEKVS